MKRHECTATEDCKHCKQRDYLKQWRLENNDKRKAQRLREYQNSAEKLKAYAAEQRRLNPELMRERNRSSYAKADRAVINEKRRIKYAESAEFSNYLRSNNSSRHKRLRQSIPNWVNRCDLKDIFIECQRISKKTGIMHHVDHIIPLKGKKVSGLTVLSNLQIIPGSENSRKNNKLVEDIVWATDESGRTKS